MSSQFHPKSSILSPHSLDFSVKSSFVTFYRYKVGECDYLPSIPHGTVDVATVTVGSQATYSCDEGYALEGPLRRTCSVAPLQGAVWDSYTPTCKSMWTVSNRKDFCFDIQSIASSVVMKPQADTHVHVTKRWRIMNLFGILL